MAAPNGTGGWINIATGREVEIGDSRRRYWLLLVFLLLDAGLPEACWAQRKSASDRPRARRKAQPVETVADETPEGDDRSLSMTRSRRASAEIERDASSAGFQDEESPELSNGPLAKLVLYARESQEALDNVEDYTAIFSRRELVKRRMVEQQMELKYRHRPFSVYFRFLSPDEAGREVIYVQGGYRNRLVVHETGIKAIAGTLYLPLDDPRVTQESRHPITSVGMHNVLKKAFEMFPKDAADEQLQVKKYPEAKLEGLPCVAFVIRHPEKRPGMAFHETRLYFDRETKMPIHVERYDWPRRGGDKPVLVEEYSYRKVRLNVGLTNQDFDPRNPRYQFPR